MPGHLAGCESGGVRGGGGAQGARAVPVSEQGDDQDMVKPDAVFIYMGTYPDQAAPKSTSPRNWT